VSLAVKPQGIAGVGGALLAAWLVARGNAWGPRLAVASASLVAVGFAIVHGVPVEVGPTSPYWGNGSADLIQWLGVGSIWVCCTLVIVSARRFRAEAGSRRWGEPAPRIADSD
jgi:hypothetical protein